MNIFNPYLKVIKKAVENDPKRRQQFYGSDFDESLMDLSHIKQLRNELPGLGTLNETMYSQRGLASPGPEQLPALGDHPDFTHLRGTDNSEEHWIITGFIDVKESTRLFNRFTKATVSLITESILKAAIYTVNINQGYVQRIQGDGLMVYFGGKDKDKKSSTEDALKAFSMISYFVKNDLKDFFAENNITEIYTRAGLDLGHDKQVRWIYSGLGDAGEITTCSLHTSLVPKMQAEAKNNGIVVGKNIRTQITADRYFKQKPKPIWDYEDGRVYDFFDFDWEKFLVEKNVAIQDQHGALILTMDFNDRMRNADNLLSVAKKNKPYFF